MTGWGLTTVTRTRAEFQVVPGTMWSSDQIHWDPVDPIRWKAKFWGDPVLATENATWSQIKGMYR